MMLLPLLRPAGIVLTICLITPITSLVALREGAIVLQQSALAQTADDRWGEVTRLNQEGLYLASQRQYQAALEKYQAALMITREIRQPQGEGVILNNIGLVYNGLGEYLKALEYYQQALAIRRELNDRRGEGITLNSIARTFSSLEHYPKALEFYQRALAISQELGDRAGEGTTLNNIGFVYDSLGQHSKALEFYQQALVIYQAMSDDPGEGTTLNNIGSVYKSLGQYPKALEFYQKALTIFQKLGDRPAAGTTLNNMGLVYQSLGQYPKALEFYQQALAINQEVGNRSGEGTALNNIGSMYRSLGQYAKALEFYKQALAINQEVENRSGEGTTLNNIGTVYTSLGQYFKALEFYSQALAINQTVADLSGEGTTLNNIGQVYDSLEQPAKALEIYQQVLAIRQKVGDRSGEGITLNNIGAAYDKSGQYTKALEIYQKALAITQEVGDRPSEGTTLNNMGLVYSNLGSPSKALEIYQRALVVHQEVGNLSGEGRTLTNIGYLLAATQQPERALATKQQTELAIIFLKQAVNTYEAIRNENRSLTIEEQESYTKTVADTYRKLADLLLKQDSVLEAQAVLDLLKVQELDDYLRNVRGNAQTAQGVEVLKPEAEILKKYDLLQAQAVKLGKELTDLRKVPEAQRTAAQQQRIAHLVQLETDLNRQFNQFLDSKEIQDLASQLNRTTRRQSINLEDLNTLRNDLKQAGNAVLLYPLILDDRLELIITTPDAPPLRRTVQVTREELNRTIVEFRSAITDESVDPKPAAEKLYKLLIEPIEQDLQASNAQTILYAPDGQLRYVPLAALYDGKQWLAERYRINNITARSLTDFTSKPAQQIRLLAGAFVQGSYSFQIGDRSFALGGLPFAGKEVQQLAALIPNTRTLVDQDFSRQQTLPKLGDVTIVHLATHATFVSGQPEDSFILLGNGDRINLREIQDLSLQNVDLVVLSACQTGVGGILGNGEEILGLGYQFQRAGAKATIASLWFVNDEGTQQLMQVFYETLKQGKSKTEALQQAQMTLIRQGGEFEHPLYWAPFILIGNGL